VENKSYTSYREGLAKPQQGIEILSDAIKRKCLIFRSLNPEEQIFTCCGNMPAPTRTPFGTEKTHHQLEYCKSKQSRSNTRSFNDLQ
jgi:hypothetical protein